MQLADVTTRLDTMGFGHRQQDDKLVFDSTDPYEPDFDLEEIDYPAYVTVENGGIIYRDDDGTVRCESLDAFEQFVMALMNDGWDGMDADGHPGCSCI